MNQNPTRALLTWDNYLPEVPLYDVWTENLGVPIHETYFVPDLRTIEVGHWDEMGCNAAFIKLKDFPPSTKMRVAEIPPAAVLPEYKLSVDDIMYVLSGQGPCTVWGVDGKQHTFEWGPRSVFLMPRNYRYQLANARGHEPARIFHFNYLPLGMMMIPNVKWFFNNSALEPDVDLFGGEGSEDLFRSQVRARRKEPHGLRLGRLPQEKERAGRAADARESHGDALAGGQYVHAARPLVPPAYERARPAAPLSHLSSRAPSPAALQRRQRPLRRGAPDHSPDV